MYGCPGRLARTSLLGAVLLSSMAPSTISAATNLRLSQPRGGTFKIKLPGPAVTHLGPLERAHESRSLTHLRILTQLAQVADLVRLASSLMEPSFILEHQSYSISALVCMRWSRLIRHTAETRIGALVGLAQSWVLRPYQPLNISQSIPRPCIVYNRVRHSLTVERSFDRGPPTFPQSTGLIEERSLVSQLAPLQHHTNLGPLQQEPDRAVS